MWLQEEDLTQIVLQRFDTGSTKKTSLDEKDLARRCPLDNSRHDSASECDVGNLDKLPLELLSAVLVEVHLDSLTNFRRVNHRAMEVVDSVPEYKAIVYYAPNTLRGILAIETGTWISCQTLYDKLCTAECEHCGDFGGYLYLVTCKRVCCLCFSKQAIYLPLPSSDARRKFGLGRGPLTAVACLRSIPGRYSWNAIKLPTRLTFVDPESARQAGIVRHGSVRVMEQYVSDMASRRLRDYRSTLARRRKIDGASELAPRPPRSEDDPDAGSINPRRFIATLRTPWLDLRRKSLEWGFHCLACQHAGGLGPRRRERKFSIETFHGHIEDCGEVWKIGDRYGHENRVAAG